jgi:hypothetical protein
MGSVSPLYEVTVSLCADKLLNRYMFHQANMRVSDTPKVTLLGKNKKWSLLMAWTEAVIYEVSRLYVDRFLSKVTIQAFVTYPYLTLGQNSMARHHP